AEPHLAATADGRLLAAWIGFFAGAPGRRIAYATSADDGATWAPTRVLQAAGAPRDGADPVAAVDGAGRLFLAWLEFSRDTGKDGRIFAARLDPATGALGAAVEVAAGGAAAEL